MKIHLCEHLILRRFFVSVLLIFTLTTLTLNAQDNLPQILTPKEGSAPKINGPKVFGVRPGHPIVLTIPATGVRPMNFSAAKLPGGVKIDQTTGQISGSIAKAGNYLILLKVKNSAGEVKRPFKIVVGEEIALTPPMGWNHYNIYGTRITQENVWDQAKAMGWVGRGILDANITPPHLFKWHDIASSVILVQEAGGIVTDWFGNAVTEKTSEYGILASNGILHEQLLEIIKKSKEGTL